MTLARMTFLVAMAACTGSALHAQEQTTPGSVRSEQAGWQKQCEDKANLDKLAENLRPTFMVECVASAKLNTPQKPATQK
jgi:invasion protein IalB